MAGPTPTIEICLDGASRLRQALVATNPVAIWPLHDTFGDFVEDIISGHTGQSNNVSRGDPGMVPEYGCATGYNGSNAVTWVAHATDLNPATQFGVAFVIKLGTATPTETQALIHKENGGQGGRIFVALRAPTIVPSNAGLDTRPKRASTINLLSPFTIAPPHADGSVDLVDARHNAWGFSDDGSGLDPSPVQVQGILVFGLTLGGTVREVSYAIPDLQDWVDQPRLIICRYNGSVMQIWQATTSGTLSTLVSASYSGTVGTGDNSNLYIGSNQGIREWFEGYVQWVAWYGNDHPSEAEMATFATSFAWTNVTADVRTSDGIDAEWGIRATGPTARLGTTGVLQFSLDNSTANSAGLLGYYSPDHANCRAGFGYGCMVRLSLTDPGDGTVYRKFIGTLREIDPEPGVHKSRVTRCLVTDFFDELTSASLPTMPIVDDYVSGDIIGRILQYLPVKPHGVDAVSRGVETFAYGFDTSDERDVVLREFGRVVDSELAGGLYMRGNARGGGQLTFDHRHTRVLKTDVDWTFSNSMVMLDAGRKRGELVTRVQVRTYPRTVDGSANTVLWQLDEPLFVLPLQSLTIQAPFTDPSDAGSQNPIGGKDLVDPLDDITDYLANTAADGSGVNLTSSLSVTMTPGASKASLLLRNTGVLALWITRLQIRGRGVYSHNDVLMEASNTDLRRKYGETLLEVDQPYQDNPATGQAAADALLAAWSQERPLPRAVTLKVGRGSNAALTKAAVAGDGGDLIALTETMRGLADQQAFICGVQLHLEAGGVLETTFHLQPREQGTGGWILGLAGYSELGLTTVPVY